MRNESKSLLSSRSAEQDRTFGRNVASSSCQPGVRLSHGRVPAGGSVTADG
jgi:hypothetical protein